MSKYSAVQHKITRQNTAQYSTI